MLISEDDARRILAPHQPRLAGVIDRSWARLAANPDRASFNMKRTVATVMHNFMMNELRIEYPKSDRSVFLMEGFETIRMLIDRYLVVRVKKMDERGVTHAQETQASLSFITPDEPIILPHLPFAEEEVPTDMASVDMGYVLNDLGTRIDSKLVTARRGDAVAWSYSFDVEAPSADLSLTPAPTPPASPSTIISVPQGRGGGVRKKTARD